MYKQAAIICAAPFTWEIVLASACASAGTGAILCAWFNASCFAGALQVLGERLASAWRVQV